MEGRKWDYREKDAEDEADKQEKKQKKKELYGCFDRKRWWLAWKGKI